MEYLINLLKEKSYSRIRRFPLRKYAFSLKLILNEIDVIGRFLVNDNNIFSVSVVPYLYLKISSDDNLLLRDCFFLNKALPIDLWETSFSKDVVRLWKDKGFLGEVENRQWRFNYRVVPYDNLLLLTSQFDRNDPNFTFLSYDSLYFASFLKKRLRELSFQGGAGLDLCCGVGVQAISISPYCKSVMGVDINRKALDLAGLNASFNHIRNCDFIESLLFDKISGRFDLIVANPPFIFFSGKEKGPIDSDGGEPFGLGITLSIIYDLSKYLTENGKAFIITRSPVVKKQDYLFTSMTGLLPAGLCCNYHYISDSINTVTPDENRFGISGYRQVILEIYKGTENKFIRYPFFHRKTSVF